MMFAIIYSLITILLPIVIFMGIAILVVPTLHLKNHGQIRKEKSELPKKLDELRQLVMKNDIIMERKTKIRGSEVMYIVEKASNLHLHLYNGETLLVQGSIQGIKDELPFDFIICHPSHAVNTYFTKKINMQELIVLNGDRLPIKVIDRKS